MSDFSRAANRLRRISPEVSRALPRAAREGAELLAEEVERRAPVDAGDLKRTVDHRLVEQSATRVVWQTHVGRFYAYWVEYGHGGPKPAPPHPFFRPAIAAKRNDAIARANAVIKAVLP